MQKVFISTMILISSYTCFSQKYIGTNVRPSATNKTGYLKPYSAIEYLKAASEIDLSNELNEKIVKRSSAYLSEITTNFDFPAEFVKLDTNEYKLYQRNIKSIVEKIIVDGEVLKYNDNHFFSYDRKTVTKAVNKIIIPDSILNIVKKAEKRLMLSTGSLGFIKTKEYRPNHPNSKAFYNYSNNGAIGGMVNYLLNNPNICCKSINYVIIIDSEDKNIAYFQVVVDEINPAAEKDLKKMYHRVFEDYWIWYHSEADKYLKINRK